MKAPFYILCFLLSFCLPFSAHSQVQEAWVRTTATALNFEISPVDLEIDFDGNVVVLGNELNANIFPPQSQVITIKYAPNGDPLWDRRFRQENALSSVAHSLNLNAQGEIYIAAETSISVQETEMTVLKYDADGNELWVHTYSLEAEKEKTRTAVVDAQGAFYVAAESETDSGPSDYVLVKFDAEGNFIWTRRHDELSKDEPRAIAVDDDGNVLLTGESVSVGGTSDVVTLKYTPNGDQQWVSRYSGDVNQSEEVVAIDFDAAGNVFIAGEIRHSLTDDDGFVIKYNLNGDTAWVSTFAGDLQVEDETRAMVVTEDEKVIVAGFVNGGGNGEDQDLITIKYANSGEEEWRRIYSGAGNGLDEGKTLAVDGEGNIIVSGVSTDVNGTLDFVTIQYAPDGAEGWIQYHDGGFLKDDAVVDLAVDQQGNVYVTGWSELDFGNQATTIKYERLQATEVHDESTSNGFVLHQNYPNPYRGSTTITYTLDEVAGVSLVLYDILGKETAVLVEGIQSPGTYHVPIDARSYPAGVYLYRLQVGSAVMSRTMIQLD